MLNVAGVEVVAPNGNRISVITPHRDPNRWVDRNDRAPCAIRDAARVIVSAKDDAITNRERIPPLVSNSSPSQPARCMRARAAALSASTSLRRSAIIRFSTGFARPCSHHARTTWSTASSPVSARWSRAVRAACAR